MAIAIFVFFVAIVLWPELLPGARAPSRASGYYAAGGQIHWAVNGIAFAGDYLSAASFLGICGMIATAGYDGFLYSIGYLAGWIVALFVVAEPMKRLGKYTFTDALDPKFDSRGIKLAAAISTLVVSIFYLIPQMVGAGVLVEPLLGLPHWVGVIMVGAIVITIVATAGMTSTTYVQFLKGALLIVFSTVLVVAVLRPRARPRRRTRAGRVPFHPLTTLDGAAATGRDWPWSDTAYTYRGDCRGARSHSFVALRHRGRDDPGGCRATPTSWHGHADRNPVGDGCSRTALQVDQRRTCLRRQPAAQVGESGGHRGKTGADAADGPCWPRSGSCRSSRQGHRGPALDRQA